MNDKDYSQIRGITTKEFTNPPEARIDDLDIIPSPYLTNTIWNLVEKINGIKCVSGLRSSPISAETSAPAALKYLNIAYFKLYACA